jgi:shikimate dehydrogenase
MQNAALNAAAIPLKYEVLDTRPEDLGRALALLAEENAAGNLTVPHKEAAAALMTRVSDTAMRVGAVNTFRTGTNGELIGDNTDVAGFTALAASTLGEIPKNLSFAVFGAGGGAAAVLAAIEMWSGCTATLFARNHGRAEKLSLRFSDIARVETLMPDARVGGDIVVNATPVGLYDDEMPISPSLLRRNAVVLDLVYRSQGTPWVRAARASGRIASDGTAMLIEQGAAAFEIWLGEPADREAMWDAVMEAMEGF